MKKLLLISACAALALPGAALAQGSGWEHGAGAGSPGPSHNGGAGRSHPSRFSPGASVERFSGADLGAWRGGHWYHGAVGGRFGWWWWVDGLWYWYAGPIYPYPSYVADTYVADEDYAAPPMAGPPAAGPVWYYCRGPQGYYPYVRACPSGWQVTPATPPDYQPAPPPSDQYAPPPSDSDQGPPPPQGPPPQ